MKTLHLRQLLMATVDELQREDRGPRLIIVVWILIGICVVTQLLRFYVRWTIRQMGADDYWMFFTTALFTAFGVICTLLASAGGGKHANYVEAEYGISRIEYIRKLERIAPVFVFVGLAVGKISVALLLLQFLKSTDRWQRYFLWMSMITTSLVLGLLVIFNFAQCSPTRALWDYNVPATCWNRRSFIDYAMFASVWSASMNIALALLPISIMRKLSIPLERKIVLCSIFAIGLVAGIVGIYKASKLPNELNQTDVIWPIYTNFIYSSIELTMIIVSGTLPTYCPLWDLLLDQIPLHPLLRMSTVDREAALRSTSKMSHHNSATWLQLSLPSNVSIRATTEDASRSAQFMTMLRTARTNSRPGSCTIRMDKTIEVTWMRDGVDIARKRSIFGSFSRMKGGLFRGSTSSRHPSSSVPVSDGTQSAARGDSDVADMETVQPHNIFASNVPNSTSNQAQPFLNPDITTLIPGAHTGSTINPHSYTMSSTTHRIDTHNRNKTQAQTERWQDDTSITRSNHIESIKRQEQEQETRENQAQTGVKFRTGSIWSASAASTASDSSSSSSTSSEPVSPV